MCEIILRDGIYNKGKVSVVFVSSGVYDQEVIDAEAEKLMRFLNENVSSGMCNALFDIMLAERAHAHGYSIGEGGE